MSGSRPSAGASTPWRRRRVLATAGVVALALCGCAGGDGPSDGDPRAFGGSARHGGDSGAERAGGRGLNVFLSPSGEPFHGTLEGPYASAAWFSRADTDQDGRLTLAEFRIDALRAFAAFDTDGDGVIDAFEIQHYEQVIAPEILPRIGGLRAGEGADDSLFHGHGGGGGGGRGRRGGGGPSNSARREVAGDRSSSGAQLYAMLAEPEPVTAADADVSGTVTRAEWLARTDRRFALLDAGGRGYLTLADLPKPEVQLLLERRRAHEAARSQAGHAPPVAPVSGG